MVSLNDRQEMAGLCVTDPELKGIQSLLEDGRLPPSFSVTGIRAELLLAISGNDFAQFRTIAEEIGRRRISSQSDWCQDDYLLFLLLLGNEKFGRPVGFLSAVIEVRRQNSNRLPQKINEVFAAIERGEFGIEGEFGFLKIPLLRALGRLTLGPSDARKAFQAMSKPGLLDQMPPFLKLLTQTAHDLILIERQPSAGETTTALIDGLQRHTKDLSLAEWCRVIAALPGRVILTVICALTGLGLIPVLIGAGTELVRHSRSQEAPARPREISIATTGIVDSNLPPELLLLADAMSASSAAPTNKPFLISAQAKPFLAATPPFAVEASHPDRRIESAIAFVSVGKVKNGSTFTILPVQRANGRVRAIVPAQPPGTSVSLILKFQADSGLDPQSIGRGLMLRPLE